MLQIHQSPPNPFIVTAPLQMYREYWFIEQRMQQLRL
jgi:hypothetical protein